jgi:hypothetical protein
VSETISDSKIRTIDLHFASPVKRSIRFGRQFWKMKLCNFCENSSGEKFIRFVPLWRAIVDLMILARTRQRQT